MKTIIKAEIARERIRSRSQTPRPGRNRAAGILDSAGGDGGVAVPAPSPEKVSVFRESAMRPLLYTDQQPDAGVALLLLVPPESAGGRRFVPGHASRHADRIALRPA